MSDKLMFVLIFSSVWLFIGIIFFIIGIAMLKNRKRKEINCTSKTYGKVKDIVRRTSRDGDGSSSSSWHPVFEYEIGELKFIKESSFGSSQSKYAIGQTVEIYFNPEDYHEFYVAEEKIQKILGKVFTIVGSVLIIIAILSAILVMLYF